MSKNPDADSPNNLEQYRGSSAGAVWIVVAASAVLGVVALIGSA